MVIVVDPSEPSSIQTCEREFMPLSKEAKLKYMVLDTAYNGGIDHVDEAKAFAERH